MLSTQFCDKKFHLTLVIKKQGNSAFYETSQFHELNFMIYLVLCAKTKFGKWNLQAVLELVQVFLSVMF